VSSDAKLPAATPSRTQAERRATTETRLLEAAYGIVADHGVRAVTTAAVGERAGYSRGIVNHHFGSRDQLMMRLAETAQGRFAPDPGPRRGREHVLSVVDDYLATVRSNPRDMCVFLRLWAAAIGDEEPSLRDAFARRDAFFRDYFEDAITEGLTDGSIRGDVDASATAVALVGLVRGIAMQCQVDPALAGDDRARAAALALIEHGLTSSR
jgi:AcrR family transcriptional regulator